jgi:hypothetical protein
MLIWNLWIYTGFSLFAFSFSVLVLVIVIVMIYSFAQQTADSRWGLRRSIGGRRSGEERPSHGGDLHDGALAQYTRAMGIICIQPPLLAVHANITIQSTLVASRRKGTLKVVAPGAFVVAGRGPRPCGIVQPAAFGVLRKRQGRY